MAEHPGSERKKHRHDLGHEDHGPKLAAGTTRAIQAMLGLWIALTLGLVVYALIDASRPASGPAPQRSLGRSILGPSTGDRSTVRSEARIVDSSVRGSPLSGQAPASVGAGEHTHRETAESITPTSP